MAWCLGIGKNSPLQVVVFWILMPCRDVVNFTLKMCAVWSSEMLVYYHITTWCQKPEDNLNLICRENFKPHNFTFTFKLSLVDCFNILAVKNNQCSWINFKPISKSFWTLSMCPRIIEPKYNQYRFQDMGNFHIPTPSTILPPLPI